MYITVLFSQNQTEKNFKSTNFICLTARITLIPRTKKEKKIEFNKNMGSKKRKYACLQDRRLAKNIRRRPENQNPTLSTVDGEKIQIDLLKFVVNSPKLLLMCKIVNFVMQNVSI